MSQELTKGDTPEERELFQKREELSGLQVVLAQRELVIRNQESVFNEWLEEECALRRKRQMNINGDFPWARNTGNCLNFGGYWRRCGMYEVCTANPGSQPGIIKDIYRARNWKEDDE